MSTISSAGQSPFDAIRQIDQDGEHWRGRRLMTTLDYVDWRNFQKTIKLARAACVVELGETAAQNHFVELNEMVRTGSGATRSVPDYRLSRMACYLTAMRGDANKAAIAAALIYFAARTRQAEAAAERQQESGGHATSVNWDQAAAIARQHYGLMVDANEFRELLNKGGILTNQLRPHRKWEHLFWPLATRWEIHEIVLPQLINFAIQIRREFALAERNLQMSLPFPITGLVRGQLDGGA